MADRDADDWEKSDILRMVSEEDHPGLVPIMVQNARRACQVHGDPGCVVFGLSGRTGGIMIKSAEGSSHTVPFYEGSTLFIIVLCFCRGLTWKLVKSLTERGTGLQHTTSDEDRVV